MSKLICLTREQVTIVDDENYEWLSQWKWYARKDGSGCYRACRGVGSPPKHLFMHRQILKAPQSKMVDHKNHNTLDNRKRNLRLCTNTQNQQNQLVRATGTSRYKGVCLHKASCKWQAQIKINGKDCYIGIFKKEENAARAYDKKAREIFGEFAKLNFEEIEE